MNSWAMRKASFAIPPSPFLPGTTKPLRSRFLSPDHLSSLPPLLLPGYSEWFLGDLSKCYLLQAAFPDTRLGCKILLWSPTAPVLSLVTTLPHCAVTVSLLVSLPLLDHGLLKDRGCIFFTFAVPGLSMFSLEWVAHKYRLKEWMAF